MKKNGNMKKIAMSLVLGVALVFAGLSFGVNSAQAAVKVLKVTSAINSRIRSIMGYGIGRSIRYKRRGSSTIWVLNRVGKTKNITALFVVSGGRVRRAKVLRYRESVGGEVQRASYLSALAGSCRGPHISGATLSVNSMRRMCRLARYLHSQAK